jgi:hypothetical protein
MHGSGSVVLFQRVSGSGTTLVARNLTTSTERILAVSNFTFLAQGSVFDAPSADGRYLLPGNGGFLPRIDTITGDTPEVTRAADGVGHALSDSGRHASCFTRIGQVGVVPKDLETGQSVTLPATDFAPGLPTNNGTLVVQVGTELVELNFTSPVVTLDTVAGDHVVNGAEKSAPVTLSGTSDQVGGLVEVFSSLVRVATATVAMDGSWTTTADFSLIRDGATVTPGAGGTVIGVAEDGHLPVRDRWRSPALGRRRFRPLLGARDRHAHRRARPGRGGLRHRVAARAAQDRRQASRAEPPHVRRRQRLGEHRIKPRHGSRCIKVDRAGKARLVHPAGELSVHGGGRGRRAPGTGEAPRQHQ